jgi:hypothetical protein
MLNQSEYVRFDSELLLYVYVTGERRAVHLPRMT